jgi:hypothetical protein
MMMDDSEGLPMEQMKEGGIPQRYKNMGFNKVGAKKKSTRPGKKWMVLAKKGDDYKVVHGGYKGMQDYTQHGSDQRRKNFWNRMGGKNSSKASDPFSPLYWHKRFGTWANGGEIDMYGDGGYYGYDGKYHTSTTPTWSGNAGYAYGGDILYAQEGITVPKQSDYPDYESYSQAMDAYIQKIGELGAGVDAERAATEKMWQEAEQYAKPVNIPPIRVNDEPSRSIDYKGVSIVDMLGSLGKATDYNSRKQLAQKLGIANYRSTNNADQNLELIRRIISNPEVLDDYTAAPKSSASVKKAAAPAVSSSKAKMANVSEAPAETTTTQAASMFTPAFFQKQKENYLANHPEITPAQYDAMMKGSGNLATVGSSSKQLPNKGQRDPLYFDDSYTLNQIKNDPGTTAARKREKREEFAGTMIAGLLGYGLEAAGMKLLGSILAKNAPNVIRALPSTARKALPAPRIPSVPRGPIPGPSSGGYIRPGNLNPSPKGFEILEKGLRDLERGVRSPGFPLYTTGGIYNTTSKWRKQQGGPMVGDEMDVTPQQLEMLRQMGYEFEMI